MYHRILQQCVQAVNAVDLFLDKAEQRASDESFDVGVLLHARLAPDMKDFIYQVQSATDYLKGGAAWLSGQTPPTFEDTEQTLEEVRARIRKTIAYAESIPEAQYADAAAQRVALSWAKGKVLTGEDYLLQMVVPNVYFHVAMAYAILRNSGVDVGKMDFLGLINFQAA